MTASAAAGIGWTIWRRHRLGLNVVLAIMAAAITAAQIVPRSAHGNESLLALTIIPLSMCLMYLLAIMINSDADIAATGSSYPSHMLTLPVRSRDLVLWPMLFGGLAVAVGWVAAAELIFVQRGVAAPVWWPAAMLVCVLSLLQALFWSPSPIPFLRPAIAVVLLPFLISLSVFLSQSGIAEWILVASFAAVIPVAYAIAVAGVAKGRRGDGQTWTRRPRQHMSAVRSLKPFRSPEQAQLWIEWTRNGMVLPLVVGFTSLLTLAALTMVGSEIAEMALRPQRAVAGEYGVNMPIRILIVYFTMPLWYAAILGCGVRKSDTRRKDLSLNPLLATRPMASADLVLAKLNMAARSTLLSWATVLGIFAVWLVIPQTAGDVTAPFGLLLLRGLPAQVIAGALGAIVVLIFWTWKNQVSSLFVDLTGRPWLVHGYPIVMAILATNVICMAAWAGSSPEYGHRILEALPRIAYALVVLKLLSGSFAISRLVRSRMVRPDVLAAILVTWIMAAGLLFTFVRWLLPASVMSGYILVGVLLFMPLVRLSLAPLAIDWNRHR